MSTDYKTQAADIDARAGNLFKAAPGVMRQFRGMMEEATKDGALDNKTKELMCVAIAVATQCSDCIAYHVRTAKKHGATREEMAETIGVAIEMSGGPGVVYGGRALEAYDNL